MTRTTSSPASVSRAQARRAANSLLWSRAKVTFVSTCPKCGHERPQHGYTRHVLFKLLNKRRNVDAYCIDCNVCWPISESERRAQMNALATLRQAAGNNQQGELRKPYRRSSPPESRVTLQLALRTLRGIRQRYESERTAHPDGHFYSVHVALSDSDMVWIAATIEALEEPVAAGVTEATGCAVQSSSGNVN